MSSFFRTQLKFQVLLFNYTDSIHLVFLNTMPAILQTLTAFSLYIPLKESELNDLMVWFLCLMAYQPL